MPPVLFGTSLTASGKWEGPLRRHLRKSVGQVTVINRGKNARGSDWGLRNVGVVANDHPDVVVMKFSMNDARDSVGFRWSTQNRTRGTSLPDSSVRLPVWRSS